MAPAPLVPGTANPALTPTPINRTRRRSLRSRRGRPGFFPQIPVRTNFRPKPLLRPTAATSDRWAARRNEISCPYITGRPATSATQLLLAPLVRGMTVTEERAS